LTTNSNIRPKWEFILKADACPAAFFHFRSIVGITAMNKRFYQNLGITLMVIPALVALAIQLWTGSVVSENPPEVIGHGISGRVTQLSR
jgi:hypothetical protein